jgi:hypothetical protein
MGKSIPRNDLPASLVRALLSYCPSTGVMTRVSGRGGTLAGAVAGVVNNNGYRLITIQYVKYRAHRLAWLWMTGEWPKGEIDHINGVRDDNRWENLRDVPMVTNQQNRRRALKQSQTGYLGVSRTGTDGRFKAVIQAEGREHYLGTYDTAQEAHAAYVEAKRELHAGCTI